MNVIVVLCDSLRRDHVGCYGKERAATPQIDALAERSVVMTRAYSASFPTLPCRAELFTGRFVYPYLTWGPLPEREVVLAELLGEAGYDTALVSDNVHLFERNYRYDRGFHTRIRVRGQLKDRYVTEEIPVTLPCAPAKLHAPDRAVQYLRNATLRRSEADWCCARVMRAAADWLGDYSRRRRPFFLMVDCFDPHEPWDPPQTYVDRYDPGYEGEKLFYPRYAAAERYSERELRHMRALYAGEVTLVDRWLGHLLEAIDALGLTEETALFFFSDHGFLLGEHGLVGKSGRHSAALRGWPLYRELTAVPMLARIPGVAPRRCDALVHPGDLMPTILDLARLRHPERVQAPSLLPLLHGEVEQVRDVGISSWSLRRFSRYRPSAVWTEEWSLLFWRTGIPPELYHLPSDPEQRRNVYGEHRAVARELHRRYLAELQRLETPAANYWPRRFLFTLPWGAGRDHDLYPAAHRTAESRAGNG